jgi:predicted N-acetyltransferase YhbS
MTRRDSLTIRLAREAELPALEHIVRLAFAAQFNLPSPEAFGNRLLLTTRWHADPECIFVAEADGRLVGSNCVTTWGRFGWFGPLTVHPDFWNRRIGQALLEPTMRRFDERQTSAQALFTLPNSPKHVALYQRYGFWPRRLTALLARPPEPSAAPYTRYSALDAAARAAVVREIRTLTGTLFPGLDVSAEVAAVATQQIGETLLVPGDDGALRAFAICHYGLGSEAGSSDCSVKFGAAVDAAAFGKLLDAATAHGAQIGAARVVAAVNTSREAAYRIALERDFKIAMLGIAMVRGDAVYDRADALVIEDHR